MTKVEYEKKYERTKTTKNKMGKTIREKTTSARYARTLNDTLARCRKRHNKDEVNQLKELMKEQMDTFRPASAFVKYNVLTVIPQYKEQIIYLNEDKSSWVKVQLLPRHLHMDVHDFLDLYALRPEVKEHINMMGRQIECRRWSLYFSKSYYFSKTKHEKLSDFPKLLRPYFEYVKEHVNPNFNQQMMNIYDANGSIGMHADNVEPLVPYSEIVSLSFSMDDKRTFKLRPINTSVKTEVGVEKSVTGLSVNIQLLPNTMIVMGGTCQLTHKHGVPAVKYEGEHGRRINFTARCYRKTINEVMQEIRQQEAEQEAEERRRLGIPLWAGYAD